MSNPVRHMHAMLAANSDPGSLTEQTVDVPEPAEGELLVQVRATALTAGELDWPETWPAVPCHDLSGVVAAVGAGVTGWQPGDEVYALVGFDRPGAAAEYVTVPAADVAAKPAAVSHDEAAAVPLGALTAWQALHIQASVQPGQHVLVHGGAGGVGVYAVQLAALGGAVVTATASARDHEFVPAWAPAGSSTTPAASPIRSATSTSLSTRLAATRWPGPGACSAPAAGWWRSPRNPARTPAAGPM